MQRTILMGAVIGTATVLSAGAMAGYLAWKDPAFAEVVSVRPVTRMVRIQDGACFDGQGKWRVAVRDKQPIQGTVIDGMAGGVVVHRPANEMQRTAAIAAGGQAGKTQDRDSAGAASKRCGTSSRMAPEVVAYVVHYRLHGKTSKIRMDHDPGQRLPVRDGKVVLTQDAAVKPEPNV